MINMIKADMYRILCGKGLYIALSILLLFIGLSVFVIGAAATQPGLTIYIAESSAGLELAVVELDSTDDLMRLADELRDEIMTAVADGITAVEGAQLGLQNVSSIVVYFIIAIVVLVVMASFSSGAIKNELSTGVERWKLYFSKLVLASVLTVFLLIFNIVFSAVFALIGPGDGIGYWGSGILINILHSFALQSFIMISITSFGVFLCFVTQKTAAVVSLFIGFLIVPVAVVQMLSLAFSGAIRFMYYDLGNQLMFFANSGTLDNMQILRGIIIGAIYMLVSVLCGIAVFRKKEIK